ncbi:hypothetical protein [Burkholderia diffusa]|uniref:hypothetical protein n=1 Tax=Burkholderia diffusa TaxID=488732 RepID=UPI00157A7D69|nr:hypothetical protein [Burkholderia diffusa]NTY37226.1 hypothetical protein [Burkholderia diffusa]
MIDGMLYGAGKILEGKPTPPVLGVNANDSDADRSMTYGEGPDDIHCVTAGRAGRLPPMTNSARKYLRCETMLTATQIARTRRRMI